MSDNSNNPFAYEAATILDRIARDEGADPVLEQLAQAQALLAISWEVRQLRMSIQTVIDVMLAADAEAPTMVFPISDDWDEGP